MAFEPGTPVVALTKIPATVVSYDTDADRYLVSVDATGQVRSVHPTKVTVDWSRMPVTQAAELQGLESDMQDVLYGCLIHERYETSEQALDALLPIVRKYAAALKD